MARFAPLYVRPAYGRTYATSAGMLASWYDGKDFKIIAGPYCSIRDLPLLREEYDRVILEQNQPYLHVEVLLG